MLFRKERLGASSKYGKRGDLMMRLFSNRIKFPGGENPGSLYGGPVRGADYYRNSMLLET